MLVYELFKTAELVIPFNQVLIYLSLISSFMLFRRLKPVLITTYLFAFYWGFILNKDYFIAQLGVAEFALFIYGFCGFLILALTLYSFFFNED